MLPDSPRIEGVFDAIDPASWRDRVTSDVGGAEAYARKLVHRTFDGLTLEPLVHRPNGSPQLAEPGEAPFVRGATTEGGWKICERLDSSESGACRVIELARAGGADSLWVQVGSLSEFTAFMSEKRPEIPIALQAGLAAIEVASACLEEGAPRHGWAMDIDPLGTAAHIGKVKVSRAQDMEAAAALLSHCTPDAKVTLWVADTSPYHNAGASRVQELGCALATGLAYLRAGEAAGVSLTHAADAIRFRLCATPELWDTVATHRALRACWSELLTVCGVEPRAARVHTVTSARVLTERDPWVNVLRNTMGVLGGALGGAEWITSLAFDGVNGTPTPLGRRVARQTQHVLAHEARLASTVDLAGGSELVEAYTESLASAAWAKLQEIESLGGMGDALVSGRIHEQVDEVRQARERQIRTRAHTKVGVSNYVQLDAPTSSGPDPIGSSSVACGEKMCSPLSVWRDAQLHDALRDAADAWCGVHGDLPTVALRTLGPVKGHGDRLTWVMHVLASAGVRAETSAFSPGERLSGAVVLCGSQAAYEACEEGPVTTLKEAGAEHVWVVGRREVPDEGHGQRCFAEGLDLVGRLEQLHRDLGVSA